jgi:predicted dinucleotide-binding enzyme
VNIGILGAGHIGGTLGRLWAAAGHSLCFGTRDGDAASALARELGASTASGTVADAIAFGSVILLAIPHSAVEAVATENAPKLSGKLVIDATNGFKGSSTALPFAGGSSAWTASRMPGALVVKAFNTAHFATLVAEAHRGTDPIAIPVATDHAGAANIVEGLVRDAGFEPVRVGGLAEGAGFEPGSPFFNTGLRAADLRRWLALPRAK